MTYNTNLHRPAIRERLGSQRFDLIIVGGGITGAGIALDAALRGLTVALVEKDDFASGTSSKSTKLIHGGLRYLKQLEVNLVREVGRERATVHRMAPHLVTAEKMLLPLVEGGSLGEWSTWAALWVYDALAGVTGDDKRKMLDKQEALAKEPLLRADILNGAGFYAEYRTDDARLTIESLKKAIEHGAICANYMEATDFVYEDDRVAGICCADRLSGHTLEIRGEWVVNAAGPWVDRVRSADSAPKGKRLFLSKGVHIVVPHQRMPIKHAVYFDTPDGRMVFAIPRHKATYIGTTDTPYDGDLDDIPVTQADVAYLLEACNAIFPTLSLTEADVDSSWAGLRPLIYEEGKSGAEMSRKDEIFESERGLISIAGGKLTGFRKMAERIVDLVAQRYEKQGKSRLKPCTTDSVALCGGVFEDAKAVTAYRKTLTAQIKSYGLGKAEAAYLVSNYGRQADEVIAQMQSYNDDVSIALVRAEAWYTVHHELTASPLDFFVRRSGRLYFDIHSIAPARQVVMEDFAAWFGWDEAKRAAEEALLDHALQRAYVFEMEEA